jgi:hypothetical protein
MMDEEESSNFVVTQSDIDHANLVLKDFMEMEPKFMEYLGNDNNWIHEGLDDDDNWTPHGWVKPDSPCNCGCG